MKATYRVYLIEMLNLIKRSVDLIKQSKRLQAVISITLISLFSLSFLVNFDNSEGNENSQIESQTAQIIEQTQVYALILKDSRKDTLSFRSAAKFIDIANRSVACLEGYSLSADGINLAFFKSEKEADEVLEKLAKSNAPANMSILAKGYSQNIAIKHRRITASEFTNFDTVDSVTTSISKGKQESIYYVVTEKDTLDLIATQNGITLANLEASNPGITKQKYLKVGLKLLVEKKVPLLTATLIGELTTKTEVKPSDTTVSNSSLYEGETKVLTEGKSEIKQLVQHIKLTNGKVIERKTITENIIQKMEPKTIAKGTKKLVVASSKSKISSTLGRPAKKFIVFSRFGKRGSGFHTGIDLSMPQGSPIYAAEDGTVVFSGNQGTYGLVITIDHGNGIKTLYSHNSKNLVTVGTNVEKGQLIAKSGQTGRATGPHLHFEVRKNNIPMNPERFLNF